MTYQRRIRLLFIFVLMIGMFGAAYFIIGALDENISLYYTPSDIKTGKVIRGPRIRFGGYVKPDSSQRLPNLGLEFTITDGETDLLVRYQGVVPDLFREGQGVVASGVFNARGVFIADQLLVKHDAGYTPPVLPSGKALLKQGPEKILDFFKSKPPLDTSPLDKSKRP